ncbi:CopD family protein [Actinomycetes bacterium KLBMP 9797]
MTSASEEPTAVLVRPATATMPSRPAAKVTAVPLGAGLREGVVGVVVTAAVAVILAYAYGVGMRSPATAQVAPPTGAPAPTTAAPSTPPGRAGAVPVGGVPPAAAGARPPGSSAASASGSASASPESSGTPSAAATATAPPSPSPSPTCDSTIVSDLPLVGPLLGPLVDSLIGGSCAASATPMVLVSLAHDEGGPAGGVRTLDVAARIVGYLALAVFLGGLLFVTALWPAGAADRRTRRILGLACACGAVAAVADLWVRSRYGTDLADAVATPTGRALAAKALLWLLAGVVLSAVLQHADRSTRATGWRIAALAVGLGLLRTTGMTAHAAAAASAWWSVLVDLAHLAAVAAWFGGLTVLLLGVLPRRHAAELSVVVPGFSRFARVAVLVLAGTGAVLAIQLVGSWHALTHTRYGVLLIVKLGALGLVLLAAWRSKTWVARRLDLAVVLRGDAATVRPFVASVAAETVLLLAVVGAASLLVTATPGR